MKNQKILVKFFSVTSSLLLILLLAQFIFQTFYFEEFYVVVKEHHLIEEMKSIKEEISGSEETEIDQKLFKYAREQDVVLGAVNIYGRPVYGFDTKSQYPFVDIIDRYENNYRVYINHFIDTPNFIDELNEAKEIKVWGQIIKSKYNEVYPLYIELDGVIHKQSKEAGNGYAIKNFVNKSMLLKMVELEGEADYIYTPDRSSYGIEYREARLLRELGVLLNADSSIYTSFDRGEGRVYQRLDAFTGSNNMIGVLPVMMQEEPMFLVSMISLQPIEEAVKIMNLYFILIFILVFLVSLILVYIYAKQITKPLVHLNDVTKKLSNLDFSDRCYIESNDEVGSLACHINEMSDKLKVTIEQLKQDLELKEQLDEARRRFIGDVSHELKTPLTVLKGTCEGLVDGVYDRSEDEHFETMLQEVNDMGKMIQDLLHISRIESEEILVQEPFEISEIIYKVHSHLKHLAKEKELKIYFNLEEAFVIGDEKKIETVIRNIYNNAIFYTPEKGEIYIKTVELGGKVTLSIENYGVFVENHELNKIWDAFYRVDQSRNKELGGSGLGLYIVKQILEKHHSQFGLQNTDNGVEVWFRLERCEE